jgi:hypothetical protein
MNASLRLLLPLALFAAACGDKPPKSTPPPNATPVADAAPTAAVADPAPALPKRTCPVAHAAAIGTCTDGLRCVLLYEISDACVVKVANELEIPDLAMESDGAGVEDLVWPAKDGALYVVNRTETWSWAAVPSPLTAPRDALAKATWTPQKVGDTEPEGHQYGLASDGAKAILVGCQRWGDDCGPDAEECEEWYCEKHLFVDPHTKKTLAKQPSLAYVAGAKTGKITETVTLGSKGKGKRKEQTCSAAGAEPETFYGDALDGSIAFSPTDWIALRYERGTRMSAKWGPTLEYMRGCEGVEDANPAALGPTPLWARATEDGFELQLGPFGGAALTDATGKVKAFGDELFTFAVE